MKEWILASLYGSGTNTPFDITPIGAIWFLLASFWGSIGGRLLKQYVNSVCLLGVSYYL